MSLGDLYDDRATLISQQAALVTLVNTLIQQLRSAHYTGRNDVITADSDTNSAAIETAVTALGTTVTALCSDMAASLPLQFVKHIERTAVSEVHLLTVSPIYVSGAGSCTHGLNLNAVSDAITVALS